MQEELEPEQTMEIRFTMSKNEIDESLPNVHWVWLDLGVPDGSDNIQA
jgi:hypothetical protein